MDEGHGYRQLLGTVTAPTGPETDGDGVFDLLARLLDRAESLLLQAAPFIGAVALIWLAIEVKFQLGRVVLIALSILLMIVFVRNVTAGCDLLAGELMGADGTCVPVLR